MQCASLAAAGLLLIAVACSSGSGRHHDRDVVPPGEENRQATRSGPGSLTGGLGGTDLLGACRRAAKASGGWDLFGPENVRALGDGRFSADVRISKPRERMFAKTCEYDQRAGTAIIR